MAQKEAKEDVSKLPRWARQRLAKLEADVEHWRKQALSAAVTGPEKTEVRMVVLEDGGLKAKGLPAGTEIEFVTAGGRVHCSVGAKGKYYDEPVLTITSPDGRLLVRPYASNMVHVSVENR